MYTDEDENVHDDDCDCDDLNPAREVWRDMEEKGYRDQISNIVNDSEKVDAFCYMLVHDAQRLGSIIELPHIPSISFNSEMKDRGIDPVDSQSYLMDMVMVRSLMISSFMYGLYHRDTTAKLENLWKE